MEINEALREENRRLRKLRLLVANVLVQDGFLTSLRSDQVVNAARRYGEPVELLEAWPQ